MARSKETARDFDARIIAARNDLIRKMEVHAVVEGDTLTPVPGLRLYRCSVPTACNSAAYMPSLVVFLQGEKRINVAKKTYLCGPGHLLLTSVDMPVVSQVVKATHEMPMLGLILSLEMPVVRELLNREELHFGTATAGAQAMAAGVASEDLLSACSRLLDLLDKLQDIPFLSSPIQHEIIYRLLRSPQGQHLRAIATQGEQSHRTARVVSWLRANYAKPLRVEELAEMAQMGVSTLHHHFRSLTAMSPLQYQKHLRLHVARERMLNEGLDAASAAFEVGYESASQFSREYSRFFGDSPMRDIRAQRMSMTELRQ